MIDKNFFFTHFQRLEKQFNQGKEVDPDVRDEYFKALKYFYPRIFEAAIDEVIKTHRPYTGHVFPSIAVILDCLNDISLSPLGGTMESQWPPVEDVCQQCGNIGLYLDLTGNDSKFCQCKYGDKRRATFRKGVWSSKEIKAAWDQEKSNAPLVKGLKEFNPKGFWENTQAEHNRWMAVKREELAAIKKRVEERKARLAAAKKVVRPESIREIVKETIRQIEDTRPLRTAIKEEVLERKLGEDEEECPF